MSGNALAWCVWTEAVEGVITEVDEAHVVVQGTGHGLATPANEIAMVTVLAP